LSERDDMPPPDDSEGRTQFLQDETSAPGTKRRIPTLLVLRGKNIGEEYVMRERHVTIGRTLENDVFINDPKISRRHARIIVEQTEEERPPKCVVVDLGSTNGIRVNDQRVKEIALNEGDKLSVGDTILRFNYQDVVDLRYQSQIKQLINIDNLTKLFTKRAFDIKFEQDLLHAKNNKEEISVFMMDLDHFKKVNDEHDHLVGSLVLHEVGLIIKRVCDPHGISGRYGGEEFVSYFPRLSKRKARALAERVRMAIADHLFVKGATELHITISIGISTYPEDGDTPEMLVMKADHALYQAKKNGRDRVCISEATQDNLPTPPDQ